MKTNANVSNFDKCMFKIFASLFDENIKTIQFMSA